LIEKTPSRNLNGTFGVGMRAVDMKSCFWWPIVLGLIRNGFKADASPH